MFLTEKATIYFILSTLFVTTIDVKSTIGEKAIGVVDIDALDRKASIITTDGRYTPHGGRTSQAIMS